LDYDLSPTVIVLLSVICAPLSSVTRIRTSYVPFFLYFCVPVTSNSPVRRVLDDGAGGGAAVAPGNQGGEIRRRAEVAAGKGGDGCLIELLLLEAQRLAGTGKGGFESAHVDDRAGVMSAGQIDEARLAGEVGGEGNGDAASLRR
jgi:hypothetical protein